ncbi:hypothetical protein DASC09_030070 [Saccharomycopsis crataegensis]|uniref:Uncharacterized protein n=1 Tax=Saccharomycopsis crataegensis TaxID=43959 RepID=A0AAV5QLM3_9ASCO|nr:hypothetical protein DASC09_030070 [Saccharomycopsis crataegensis]
MSSEQKPFTADSKTAAHLKSYPILVDIATIISSSALVRAISDHVMPLFTYVTSLMMSVALIKTILVKSDEFFNSLVLDNVDAILPSLRSLHLQDVHPKKIPEKARAAASNLNPSIVLNDVNAKLHAYEQQIRPNVSNHVGGIIKPLNNKLETLIDSYLPEGEQDASAASQQQGPDDEISRLYNLTSSAYKKTVPIATNEISHIQDHVMKTYSANLPENESPSTPSEKLQAAAKTSYQLSNEGLQLLNKTYETSVKPKVAPYIGSLKVGITRTVDEAKSNVDASLSEAAQGAETATMNGSSGSQ